MKTVYQVRDAAGVVVAEHVRLDKPHGKKAVWWQLPDGRTELGAGGSEALPLYGCHRLGGLPAGATVLLTEGEKAAEAVWRLGWPAVGTVTGASAIPGEDAVAVLLPFDVVTWEDHDAPGEQHMGRTVARLRRLGGDGRRLLWGRQPGDDAADYLAAGLSAATLAALVRLAPRWRETAEHRPEPRVVRLPRYRGDDGRTDTARAQLVEVVTQRLGPPAWTDPRGYWWRCPFHDERSASFKVDTREPFYRCFGCGARGDVFIFLRELDGQGFKDALGDLAPPRLLGAAIPG